MGLSCSLAPPREPLKLSLLHCIVFHIALSLLWVCYIDLLNEIAACCIHDFVKEPRVCMKFRLIRSLRHLALFFIFSSHGMSVKRESIVMKKTNFSVFMEIKVLDVLKLKKRHFDIFGCLPVCKSAHSPECPFVCIVRKHNNF